MKHWKIILLSLLPFYLLLNAMEESEYSLEDSFDQEEGYLKFLREPLWENQEAFLDSFQAPPISDEQYNALLQQFMISYPVLPTIALPSLSRAQLICPWHDCRQRIDNPTQLYNHLCQNHFILHCFCEKTFPCTTEFINHITSHSIEIDTSYIQQAVTTNLGFLIQMERNKERIHNNRSLARLKQWLRYNNYGDIKKIADLSSPLTIIPSTIEEKKKVLAPSTRKGLCVWHKCKKKMKDITVRHLYMHIIRTCKICGQKLKGNPSLQRHIRNHTHSQAEQLGLSKWFLKNKKNEITLKLFIERYLLLIKKECQDSLREEYGIDKNSPKTLRLDQLEKLHYIKSADGLSWGQIVIELAKVEAEEEKPFIHPTPIFLSTDSIEGVFRCPWDHCPLESTAQDLLNHIDNCHIIFPCIICNLILHPREMITHVYQEHQPEQFTSKQLNWMNIFMNHDIEIPYFIVCAMIDSIKDDSKEQLRIRCQNKLSDKSPELIKKAGILRGSLVNYYVKNNSSPFSLKPSYLQNSASSEGPAKRYSHGTDSSDFWEETLQEGYITDPSHQSPFHLPLYNGNKKSDENPEKYSDEPCEPYSPSCYYLHYPEVSPSEQLEGRTESFTDLAAFAEITDFLSQDVTTMALQ